MLTGSQGWGRRWLRAMKAMGHVERISRGKAHAKDGQVLSPAFAPGRVTAQVEASRWPPYDVRCEVDVFNALQWQHLLDAIARRPLFSARLLAGELPADLETVFADQGLSLLPERGVTTSCTCFSEASCAHVAAVCHVVAGALDADPFQLFVLRGRTRAQVVGALRDEEAHTVALPTDAAKFWGRGTPRIDVDLDPPPVGQTMLRRVGAPGNLDPDGFVRALSPACEVIALAASRLVTPP